MAEPVAAVAGPKPGVREKSQLLSDREIERSLTRLAYEIVERNNGASELVVVGVQRRGAPLAERLAAKISDVEQVQVPVAAIDITFYRDDLSTIDEKPVVKKSLLPFPVEGQTVILVDDVLYTGRTTRAALDALIDQGRPRRVELCVLIDRGHRELPVQADYIGRKVQTSDREVIEVRLFEIDHEERVMLCERVD